MTTFYSTNRAFTLVELLVVISIIGMLSSVVLVGLQGARDKGRTASLINFTTYNNRKLGIDTVLSVNFDGTGPSDTTAPVDKSGNGFSTASTITRSAQTPFSTGQSFDASAAGNLVMTRSTLTAQTTDYTLSAWVNRNTTSNVSEYIVSFDDPVNSPSRVMYVQVGANLLCWQHPGISVGTPVASINDGKWHNILCSLKGNTLSLYIDGKYVNQVSGITGVSGYTSVGIGNSTSNAANFPGLIDNVEVYSQALTAFDIQNKYAVGLRTHTLAADK